MALIAVIAAYLVGSIPTSFIFAKLMKGVDIRNYGSGNVGATNLSRITGKLPSTLALVLDIIKGVVAVLLVAFIFISLGLKMDPLRLKLMLGVAAVSGHIWPVFLKFKGGKGIATSAGVLAVIVPKVVAIVIVIWALTVLITRFISLSSVVASISVPISAALLGYSVDVVIFCIILCVITTYKHKTNISRLMKGEEPRMGKKIHVK